MTQNHKVASGKKSVTVVTLLGKSWGGTRSVVHVSAVLWQLFRVSFCSYNVRNKHRDIRKALKACFKGWAVIHPNQYKCTDKITGELFYRDDQLVPCQECRSLVPFLLTDYGMRFQLSRACFSE